MIATVSDRIRRATTLLLAVFLWAHALFLIDVQSTGLSRLSKLRHFTDSEAVLFGLLVALSFLSASGFWRMLRSVLYIYLFPFVLIGYGLYCCALMLRAINRWFRKYAPTQPHQFVEATKAIPPPGASGKIDGRTEKRNGVRGLLRFLSLPFRTFMTLWCILLLTATHIQVVWLCLIVVMVQLARKIFLVFKILLFSEPWLRKYGRLSYAGFTKSLSDLESIKPDAPTKERESLRGQLKLWKDILEFFRDPYLLSRWAWVFAFGVFISFYVYFSGLFSFAYFGIARVSGITYSWPTALTTALFIPFYATDLPKSFFIRLLGGFQCSLVVALGVGTAFNFLQRKLNAISDSAAEFSIRLNQAMLDRPKILEEAGSSATPAAVPET